MAALIDIEDDLDEEIRRDLGVDLDAGFARLVVAHQRTVTTVAGRMSGRPEDADDLCAEAFLRAWRALRGYDAQRIATLRIRPWLVTIVLNLVRNAHRDAARRGSVSSLDGAPELASTARDASDVVAGRSDRDELVVLLASLSERERAAVVLRHVAGLPVAEIADVLDCPQATARSHVARGLAKLRAAYDDEAVPSRKGGSR